MKKLDYTKLNAFIATEVMRPFYEIRLKRLQSLNLKTIIKRKNPYLFKAKNIETAGELAKNILDAFLSSQEETIFGDLMESLAIHVCKEVFSGKKAQAGKYRSVDLIFTRESRVYVVGIKSGPNWGNSDQINIMCRNFKKALQTLKKEGERKEIVAVNGCIYGKDNQLHKAKNNGMGYEKLCGQKFWELISGDNELYRKIIQPLDKEAKRRDASFRKKYSSKINELTKDILNSFCKGNSLDWNKVVESVSKSK